MNRNLFFFLYFDYLSGINAIHVISTYRTFTLLMYLVIRQKNEGTKRIH